MNEENDRVEESLLQRYVVDGPEGLAPEERRRIEGSAESRRQVAELRVVMERLAQAGYEERERVTREMSAQPGAPGEERAGDVVERAFAASRRKPAWIAVAAAAAALLLFWFVRGEDESTLPDDLLLGEGDVTLLEPLGAVDAFTEFRWEVPPGFQGTYDVEVFDGEDEAALDPVLEARELDHARWAPEPAQIEALPARIRWRVVARDATSRRSLYSPWAVAFSRSH